METATITKAVKLISIELSVNRTGREDRYNAIAIVKIEGYPEDVTFTAKSAKHYDGGKGGPLFEVVVLIRNNGTVFHLDQLAEGGIVFDFQEVTEAHKALFEKSEQVEKAAVKEHRSNMYDTNALVLLKKVIINSEDYKVWAPFTKLTSKENYVETGAGLYSMGIMRHYKNKTYDTSVEYSNGNFKLKHNYKSIPGVLKSAESTLKKINSLWNTFCRDIDAEEKTHLEKVDKAKELTELLGHMVTEEEVLVEQHRVSQRFAKYKYWCIAVTKDSWSRKMLFTTGNESDGTPKFSIRGIEAQFSLENFKKIIDLFIISTTV